MADRLEAFRKHILDGASELPPDTEIQFRKMFGGMGAYARGRFFAATFPEGFALKFSPQECERRRERRHKAPGAVPPHHEPRETTSSYVTVPPAVLADPVQLREWVEASIAYVQTLPVPKRKKKKTAPEFPMTER